MLGTAVFALPNELLLRIFRIFVDTGVDQSPVVLTHVCTLWRHLILGTSSLWKYIDLRSIRRAKHHLALAHGRPLDITWMYTRQAVPQLERYEWIFSQASRFRSLGLVMSGAYGRPLLCRLGNDLSQLQHLLVVATNFGDYPYKLAPMPTLRSLTLSVAQLSGPNLISTLRSAPLLETLDLSHIMLLEASGPVEAVKLPYLRSCGLASIHVSTQGFLTSAIVLPKSCVLNLTLSPDTYKKPFLHPSTVAALHPIRITTIRLEGSSITFAESTRGSKCTLNVTTGSMPSGELVPHGLDLATVTIVEVYSSTHITPPLSQRTRLLSLLQGIMPSLRELIIHKEALRVRTLYPHDNDGWPRIFLSAALLEILTLQDVNLDADTESGFDRIQIICRFVEALLSQERATPPKVVLRNCEIDKQGLIMLRAVVPVELIYGSA